MRRLLPLLLVLLCALTACSPAQPDAAAPDAPAAEETTQSTAPVIHDVTDAETPSEDDFPPEAESKAGEATPAEADDTPNEGDIDSGTLAQIDAVLEKQGSNKSSILDATIFLADKNDFAAMNKAWDAWVVAGHAPVRCTVQAGLMYPKYKVEIKIVAAV